MAIRTDIVIDYELSPRVVTVQAPSVSLLLQDLHDTLTGFEDSNLGGQYSNLVSSAGREDLGGGVLVAITMKMLDAVVEFEARTTQYLTPTITTGDVFGKSLIDTGSTFIASGVLRGDIISNNTDDSRASVVSIVSETELLTTALAGGTNNQYQISDALDIHHVFQCEISGGNLTAVDDVNVDIAPVFPTFGTQVVRAASSSATLVESGVSGLTAAESLRLLELYQRLGLDVTDPVTDIPGRITTQSGDIDIVRSGDGETTSTLTRQP